jgi:arginase family enzyme
LNEAGNIELAEAFLREAKCDLETADILIKAIKPGSGEPVEQGLTEDELFCIGRRILFMLQQAT